MEAKTSYTIVGLIVLILAAGLLSMGLWLSVGFNQKTYNEYTVYLRESVSGLSPESPVKFNGVKVGFVKNIKLNKFDPRQVELTLSIETGIPITNSTSATLISQGITGVTFVGLSAGSSELTPLQKMSGEPYPVIPAKPSLFNQLDTILNEVADNVNKVSAEVQRIFNEENAKYINQTLKSADTFMANMADVSKDFPHVIKDLRMGISKFNTMAENMSTAGKSVTTTMSAGKTAVDKISQQTLPPAVILLNRLNAIAANLEKVSNEMRQNPSVVLRGTKPPEPGPGE